MATKITKKKAVKKPATKKSAQKKSSVVAFTSPAVKLSQINQPLESMETVMSNAKNKYEKISMDTTSSIRESVEGLTKSGETFAKGAEAILKTLAETAQESSQRNAEAMKAMMACRTMNEFAEAQNKMAQQNFDDMMSAMTKMSEMTIKLYSEAFEPMNAQMTKAMSSMMSKNAA